MHTYFISPEFVLTNPSPTKIAMGVVTATFSDRIVIYSTRTFDIPRPRVPTWYYVTVDNSSFSAACETSDALVGVQGHTYIGAIQALPEGGGTNALAGGWPAPQTYIVGIG